MSEENGGRGIARLIGSGAMGHTSESLNSRIIEILKYRAGKNYMKDWKRPAYYGTSLCQKDIWEDKNDRN